MLPGLFKILLQAIKSFFTSANLKILFTIHRALFINIIIAPDINQLFHKPAYLALPKIKNTMTSKLESHEIEDVLKHQLIGRIGCHANDLTYVVPISYAYDGTYIYGHTYEGMKITMMRENPNVCFEVDIMETMADWKSVICWGRFEEITNTEERKAGIQILLNRVLPIISSETLHITPHWPFPPGDLNHVTGIIYRIHLTKKTGRFEKSTSGSYQAF